MKKLWATHSYTILLIVVSCLSTLFLSLKSDIKEEEYVKVTIEVGDTVWEYAEQYSKNSHLSKKQFVNWVLTKNDLSDKHLYPGDELILPIKNISKEANTELASAIGE
ncbi:cell division suppressor protein YneA [Pseudoneobacillus rhizosphaerae]|jgi:cell division protein YceG involved in septum cleavage|uniref:Cell division suppressor protein YneA n=1 Tax=Pseudoneobacillus rhizosphaerae TaxID=2880968 RepID=A0A9C7LAC8_9BACI|nr:LysM peptidoglycan-binding domain-containing protein [Pseudoneobacillus rhizosphaerae]CAG9607320.1 Cell division suppressor protein YneA [Pseudoneobacillus rhizosphaerae]